MGLTPNVVDGNPIQAAWGNEIRDRTSQVFANAAERDAQWTAPPDGAFAVTLDDGLTHQRVLGEWYPTAGLIRQSTVRRASQAVAAGTALGMAPPGIAGFWSTVADGTVTFLRPGVYATGISANRSGATATFFTRLTWTLAGNVQPSLRGIAAALLGSSYAYCTWTSYALANDRCQFVVQNQEAAAVPLVISASLVYMGATPGPVDT